MNERDVAEDILKKLLKKDLISTRDVELICKEKNLNYTVVMKFLTCHTDEKSGFGSYNDLSLKSCSADFVDKGCWTGEEKRENERIKQENEKESKRNKLTIISLSIAGLLAITGIISLIISYLLNFL